MPTQNEIHEVANEIESRGDKVTLAAVRSDLAERFGGGGGSYTTISEALKVWRSARQKQEEVPEAPMPEIVREAIELAGRKIHQAAAEVARTEIDAMKTALETKERDLNQERAEALALADQLGDEIAKLRAEKKDITEKLEGAQKSGAMAEALAEERKARIDAMAAELKAALQEAETLRTEKARLTERLDNRESEIERLRKQTDDIQARLVPAKK